MEICLAPLPASPVLTLALLHQSIVFIGPAVCTAGLLGAIYLAGLRLADRGLRDLSDPVAFFNLALLAALFAAGLWAALADPGLVEARLHLVSLFRGRPGVVTSPSLAAAMVLAGLFAAYLPFSRMFHFAAKYFTYHQVLWDDESDERQGSRMESDFAGYLQAPRKLVGRNTFALRTSGCAIRSLREADEGEPHGK